MATHKMLIPVGHVRECVVGRTPGELAMLVAVLQEEPDVWNVYSTHMNMNSAHVRASHLRRSRTPLTLLPFMENLQFKAMRDEAHGPVVAVRWRSTPS
jgi:hypothetical protein